MQYSYVQMSLGLLAVTTPAVMAHPKPLAHPHALAHPKPFDYANMPASTYDNVEWCKVFNNCPAGDKPAEQAKPVQEPAKKAESYAAPPPKKEEQKPANYGAPPPKKEEKKPANYGAPPPKKDDKEPAKTPSKPSKGSDTSSGNKAGLAYNEADLCQGFKGASWAYNWVSQPGGDIPSDLEFVPMLHDMTQPFTSVWQTEAAAQNAKHVLAFNEPDIPEQAGSSIGSAQQCAEDYKSTFEKGAPKGARYGAPAVTSSLEPGKGLDYLGQFMKACSDCKIDFITLHYYGQPDQFDYFERYVKDAKKFGKPIWMTEYGLSSGSDADQAKFIKQATELLQKEPGRREVLPLHGPARARCT